MNQAHIRRMKELIHGFWISQVVRAAALFALADHLADGPATAEEIAARAGTHPDATARFLRTCASIELVSYVDGHRYASTPLLGTLHSDNPDSLADYAQLIVGDAHWLPWSRLPDAIRTGQPQAAAALGMLAFEYVQAHPGESELFGRTMSRVMTEINVEVVRWLKVHEGAVIADIGGAAGTMLHAVLHKHPTARGIVFDLPEIAELARIATAKAGLQDRVIAAGGNFFESVPSADIYLLRRILHDWDDEKCVRILRNCREAMPAKARLVIIEHALGEIGEPDPARLMDLNMMVMLGGRERTLSEYRQLLEAAGLRLDKVIPTASPRAVMIEAVVG